MPADDHDIRRRSRMGGWDLALACSVFAVAAAVVAGFAWTRPAMTTESLGYTQSGRLSYSAPVSPTSVYGSSTVRSGQPVYTDVVTTLSLTYRYRFSSSAPASIAGTEQLVATMSNGQGITRAIPLQGATAFKGATFRVSASLSMAALQATAASFNSASGERGPGAGGTYAVAISPNVTVHGHVGPAALDASFAEPVTFSYSTTALSPSTAGSTALAGSGTASPTGATSSHDPLTSSSSGSVRVPRARPATLLGLSVTELRVASLVVLAIAAVAGVIVGWPLLRDAISDDEQRRIAARHGPALVEVNGLPGGPGVLVVDLASFEGLLQVAQRLECPVLHTRADAHAYGVVDSGTLYRYGARAASPPAVNVLVHTNGGGHGPRPTASDGSIGSDLDV